MTSATEANKVIGLYIIYYKYKKEVVLIKLSLVNLGRPQPATTPLTTNNSTACGIIIHGTMKQRQAESFAYYVYEVYLSVTDINKNNLTTMETRKITNSKNPGIKNKWWSLSRNI